MAERKRRAKSSITRLPAEQREYIERLLRGGAMTLGEIIEDLRAKFPGEPAAEVSRSALHRFDQRVEETGREIREIETAARALVGDLGEGFGEMSADLLSQAITVLAVKTAMRARDNEELSIDDARKLAVMAKNTMDSRRMSINTRKLIKQEAREELLREQKKALDQAVKTKGLSAETAAVFRKKILGIRDE